MSPESNSANLRNENFLRKNERKFLTRHPSDDRIYSNDFFISFEIKETLNHRIYILVMMINVPCLGSELRARR